MKELDQLQRGPTLCPSARAAPGAVLVGIIGRAGRVQYLKDRVEIDQAFVDATKAGRSAEQRFRFADTCMAARCEQWENHSCSVVKKVSELLDIKDPPVELPECSIRPQCRWFSQHGGAGCAVCPEVVTDTVIEIPE